MALEGCQDRGDLEDISTVEGEYPQLGKILTTTLGPFQLPNDGLLWSGKMSDSMSESEEGCQ